MSEDNINKPKHYATHPSGVECVQIAEHLGFNIGNAFKYVWRAGLKGDALEDLRKARWYVERALKERLRPYGIDDRHSAQTDAMIARVMDAEGHQLRRALLSSLYYAVRVDWSHLYEVTKMLDAWIASIKIVTTARLVKPQRETPPGPLEDRDAVTVDALQQEVARRWGTSGYGREFLERKDPQRDAHHALLHVFKAAGKIAGALDEVDHDTLAMAAAGGVTRDAAMRSLADLVICAARIAQSWPPSTISLECAVRDRLRAKFPPANATRPRDAKP